MLKQAAKPKAKKEKKAKLKLMIKIYTVDDQGGEEDVIRQFDVSAKMGKGIETIGQLGIEIAKAVNKKYKIKNVEAWTV